MREGECERRERERAESASCPHMATGVQSPPCVPTAHPERARREKGEREEGDEREKQEG